MLPSQTMGAIRISGNYRNRLIGKIIKYEMIHAYHAPFIVRKETDRHVSQNRSRLSAIAACAHCRRIIRHEKANSKQNRITDKSVYCLFTVENIMTDEAAEKICFLSYEEMICFAEAIRMGRKRPYKIRNCKSGNYAGL